jgi:hypothetical protein
MTQGMRAPAPDDGRERLSSWRPPDPAAAEELSPEQAQRARDQAEAEDAVLAVMLREHEKAAKILALARPRRKNPPLKVFLLLTLIAFNLYAWLGNPQWLRYNAPQSLSVDYYQASWKVAVYLERQRIEEYRRTRGHLPATAQHAGPVVKGVQYKPLDAKAYQLTAGEGLRRFVYYSGDSLTALVNRALLQVNRFGGGLR